MQISWYGFSCFEILTKTTKGDVKLITDPFSNNTGLRFPRNMEAEIVTMSHDEEDANNISAISGNPFQITIAGEYEIKDVFIYATNISLKRNDREIDNLIVQIDVEAMNIVHLGAINRTLSDAELESLKNVDILMIPVGGGKVLSPKQASEIISQLEPRVVIPMTHGNGGNEKFGSVEDFCKELGACKREELAKYKVSRKDLPEEDMLIMTLKR